MVNSSLTQVSISFLNSDAKNRLVIDEDDTESFMMLMCRFQPLLSGKPWFLVSHRMRLDFPDMFYQTLLQMGHFDPGNVFS